MLQKFRLTGDSSIYNVKIIGDAARYDPRAVIAVQDL
jgi:hypothetical protein